MEPCEREGEDGGGSVRLQNCCVSTLLNKSRYRRTPLYLFLFLFFFFNFLFHVSPRSKPTPNSNKVPRCSSLGGTAGAAFDQSSEGELTRAVLYQVLVFVGAFGEDSTVTLAMAPPPLLRCQSFFCREKGSASTKDETMLFFFQIVLLRNVRAPRIISHRDRLVC